MPCPKPHPQEGYLKNSLCMQYKLIAFYISGWFHFYGLNLHWTENLLVLRMVFPSYASRWFSQGTIKNRDATLYKQLSLYVQFTELTINSHSQKISSNKSSILTNFFFTLNNNFGFYLITLTFKILSTIWRTQVHSSYLRYLENK